MEVLQAMMEGTVGPPPIADLLAMSLVEVQEGRAVFAVEPAEWMYNPIGSVHGGIAATLLDSCMGCAIHSTLPAGVGYATSDHPAQDAQACRLPAPDKRTPSIIPCQTADFESLWVVIPAIAGCRPQ